MYCEPLDGLHLFSLGLCWPRHRSALLSSGVSSQSQRVPMTLNSQLRASLLPDLECLLGEPPLNLNFSAILVNCVSEFFYSWMSSILVYSVDLTVFEFVFSVSFWELEIADNILYTRWFGFFRLISSGDLRYFFCVCELGNNTYYSFIFPLFQSPSLEFIYFVLFPCIHFRICSWIFFFSPHLSELGLLLFLLLLFVLE